MEVEIPLGALLTAFAGKHGQLFVAVACGEMPDQVVDGQVGAGTVRLYAQVVGFSLVMFVP